MPARRYDIAIGGLVILLAVFYFTCAALGAFLRQSQAHASFIPVGAMVVEASVVSSGSAAAAHGESFSPRIVYRYSVGGKAYQGDRYFFAGDGWRDAASAQAVVARFPAGSSVHVYVDKADPAQAVIDKSKPRLGVLLYLLPIAGLGLGVLGYGLRKRKETR
ncbi:DUF3592 domain-containing protein [Variovorax paradoxus]|nr:DUF3592 domain-containing protein [Variovorax paradoxus]